MAKIIRTLLSVVIAGFLAVASIYWFELDEKAIRKLEPIFRKFAAKVE